MAGKRCFDLCCTSLGILLLGPVFLVIAIMIKLDSPGPVFFRQERVGRYGKRFRIFKFRTMVHNADKIGKHFTIASDPRITSFGRWLRRTKLDEIPQLFNVLKGEMSLVGPRPQVAKHVAEYPSGLRSIILSVPPGVTGLASLAFIKEAEFLSTVHNPDELYKKEILPKKLAFYLNYVYHRNFWFDLKIIIATVVHLFHIQPQRLIRLEFQKPYSEAATEDYPNIASG